MRVCFVTTTYPLRPGDAIPGFVADLAQHLVREGCEVRVIAPHHPGAAKKETVAGVRIERFQYALNENDQCLAYGGGVLANIRQFPRARWQLPGLFGAMGAAVMRAAPASDIIHAHWVEPALISLPASFLHHVPLVLTVHSLRPVRSLVQKLALANVDRALFNSEFTMRQAHEFGYRCRGQVIYQGYDQTLFGTLPRNGIARQRLGIPLDAPLVTFVGRMVPFKGAVVLAKAADEILARFPAAHLVLAGDGPSRAEVSEIIARATHKSRIHLPGALPRREVAELLADSDIFVMPSVFDSSGRTETLGVSALEAMASGVACVGSRIGGIVETILDAQTGLLFEAGNSGNLSMAVCRLLGDDALRRQLATAGKKRAAEFFAWPKLAKQVLAVYREELNRR